MNTDAWCSSLGTAKWVIASRQHLPMAWLSEKACCRLMSPLKWQQVSLNCCQMTGSVGFLPHIFRASIYSYCSVTVDIAEAFHADKQCLNTAWDTDCSAKSLVLREYCGLPTATLGSIRAAPYEPQLRISVHFFLFFIHRLKQQCNVARTTTKWSIPAQSFHQELHAT